MKGKRTFQSQTLYITVFTYQIMNKCYMITIKELNFHKLLFCCEINRPWNIPVEILTIIYWIYIYIHQTISYIETKFTNKILFIVWISICAGITTRNFKILYEHSILHSVYTFCIHIKRVYVRDWLGSRLTY